MQPTTPLPEQTPVPDKHPISPLPKLLHAPRFMLAAHQPDQWPADSGAEVAFAGRSNVGKSSAINAIMQRRNLARTSRTPGRTQQIVFFELAPQLRIVDLPGYGYAKVPRDLRRHWGLVIEQFLKTRRSLRGLMLMMDARHPGTELDQQMLGWCTAQGLSIHVLLTKSDKLSRGAAAAALGRVERQLSVYERISVQCFSSLRRNGVDHARQVLVTWLESPG